jgi:polyisoprenoid-binding protein YceI
MAQSADEKETLKKVGQKEQIQREVDFNPNITKKGIRVQQKNSRPVTPIIILNKRTSIIEWKGGLKFLNKNHTGNLKIKAGNVILEKGNKITGNLVIDMMSMTNIDLADSKKEYLIGHLRSQDFFHIERFPTASLKINSSKILEKKSNGKYDMEIVGDLTIKSITKPIVFTALVDLKSNIKSATGIIQFNRTDFGVEYRAEMHLDNAKSFWNKMNTTKETIKNKVIQDKIEINFSIISMPGLLEK